MTSSIAKQTLVFPMLFVALAGCSAPSQKRTQRSSLQWGEHQSGAYANLINLSPNESVEVCAEQDEWVSAAHSAIQQWSTALGRWGYFKVNPCNSNSDLKINMYPFASVGLNYFTANPGTINVQSNATGNYLKAIVLHEMGHSYGLCDQYSGGGGCSSSGSGNPDSSEVMGGTSQDKQTLTPGDITGVQTVGKNPQIKANSEWQAFLVNPPTLPNGPQPVATGLFASLSEDALSINTPTLLVSVPANEKVTVCEFDTQSLVKDCANSVPIALQKQTTKDGRDIYQSSNGLGGLSKSQTNVFLAMFGDTTVKFKISAKP